MTTTIEGRVTTQTGRGEWTARRVGAVAGVAAGPLFLGLVGIMTIVKRGMLHRYGWSYVHDTEVPWPSGLSFGRFGAVQIANFVVTGLLVLAVARAVAGEVRGVTGRIGSALLAIEGAALVASSFRVDRQMMLSGSPATWHGWIHEIAFVFFAVPCVLAPIFIGLALRRDARRRPLAWLSFVVPPLAVAIIFTPFGGVSFTVFLALIFGWIALLARRVLAS